MKAIDDIAAERQRQIEVEGWTPEHDDEHDDGEMAAAAACYAMGDIRISRPRRSQQAGRRQVEERYRELRRFQGWIIRGTHKTAPFEEFNRSHKPSAPEGELLKRMAA